MNNILLQVGIHIYSWIQHNTNEFCLWLSSVAFFLMSKVVLLDTLEITWKFLSIISILFVIVLQGKKIKVENKKLKDYDSE